MFFGRAARRSDAAEGNMGGLQTFSPADRPVAAVPAVGGVGGVGEAGRVDGGGLRGGEAVARGPVAEMFRRLAAGDGVTGALSGGDGSGPAIGTTADIAVALASVRPKITAEQKSLRKRFIVDHSLEGYHRALAQLAEDVVVGLLDLAFGRLAAGETEAIPVRVLAHGGLARRALAPGDALELEVVLPESAAARQPVDRIADFVAGALRAVDLAASVHTRIAGDAAGAPVAEARQLWTGRVPLEAGC